MSLRLQYRYATPASPPYPKIPHPTAPYAPISPAPPDTPISGTPTTGIMHAGASSTCALLVSDYPRPPVITFLIAQISETPLAHPSPILIKKSYRPLSPRPAPRAPSDLRALAQLWPCPSNPLLPPDPPFHPPTNLYPSIGARWNLLGLI